MSEGSRSRRVGVLRFIVHSKERGGGQDEEKQLGINFLEKKTQTPFPRRS